jgi:hypothetical protein
MGELSAGGVKKTDDEPAPAAKNGVTAAEKEFGKLSEKNKAETSGWRDPAAKKKLEEKKPVELPKCPPGGNEILLNNPDFIEFDKRVGHLTDTIPAPMRPEDKVYSIDMLSRGHHDKTVQVINEALKISTQHFTDKDGKITKSKRDIIDYALGYLVITLRQKNLDNSQNLIFRDADHYLAGRTQEWQIKKLDRDTRSSRPGYHTAHLSGLAAFVYDLLKIDGFERQANNKRANSEMDLSTCPGAAAGGRGWADLGKKDFWKEYTTLDEKVAPDLFQWPYEEPEENTPLDLQGP